MTPFFLSYSFHLSLTLDGRAEHQIITIGDSLTLDARAEHQIITMVFAWCFLD